MDQTNILILIFPYLRFRELFHIRLVSKNICEYLAQYNYKGSHGIYNITPADRCVHGVILSKILSRPDYFQRYIEIRGIAKVTAKLRIYARNYSIFISNNEVLGMILKNKMFSCLTIADLNNICDKVKISDTNLELYFENYPEDYDNPQIIWLYAKTQSPIIRDMINKQAPEGMFHEYVECIGRESYENCKLITESLEEYENSHLLEIFEELELLGFSRGYKKRILEKCLVRHDHSEIVKIIFKHGIDGDLLKMFEREYLLEQFSKFIDEFEVDDDNVTNFSIGIIRYMFNIAMKKS